MFKKMGFFKAIRKSVLSEYIGIVYLLVHRHELDIKTGCIYLNGKLEAFTIASPLKHNTIQIHVEKANKDIRGLYVAIGKFFLEHNFKDYELVNREEDMGIELLRKAKQSLHPVKMIKKYTIVLNKQEICKAADDDLHAIIDLWRNSFEDEDEYSTNFYFMNCYQKENTYLLKNNKKIVSMLQIVPYTILLNNQETPAYFILGVATDKAYQKQGLMKKLMNYVLALPEYVNQKIMLQAYNPKIYHGFGFKENYFHKITIVTKETYSSNYKSISISTEIDLIKITNLYNHYCKKFNGYRKRTKAYYQDYLFPRCKAYHEEIILFLNDKKEIGYVIYQEDKSAVKVSEIIYNNQKSLEMMISYFVNTNKDIIVESDIGVSLRGDSKIICTMLTNFIDNNENNLFINECL